MSDGAVHLQIDGAIASVVFDRPQARNAMTWAMYEALGSICDRLRADAAIRVVTFRGAGGEAFVAGTDIEQFKGFDGDAGVAYERGIDAGITLIATLPMPTLAIIEGWAVGGGLAIATACDFRFATPDARLGVPIAKTLGNCLSVANLSRLVAAFGRTRVQRMLIAAELLTAGEALACGYLTQVVAPPLLDNAVADYCKHLSGLAPVTQAATKEALGRLLAQGLPGDEDLIRRCYGSDDFREGVASFVGKRSPVWRGC